MIEDLQYFRDRLLGYCGIRLTVTSDQRNDGFAYRVRPSDFGETEGFEAEIVVGWGSIHCRFIPETFSIDVIRAMESSNDEQRMLFTTFVSQVVNDRGTVRMVINDQLVDAGTPQEWPSNWQKLELSLQTAPLENESGDGNFQDTAIVTWSVRFLGMILSLLPVEQMSDSEDSGTQGATEGDSRLVIVRRYERSSLNRAACIDIHGTRCQVCEFDFGDFYGPIGDDFIHVHHLVPVSEMGSDYRVDPATDLIPVCPNCHAMLHRRNPPLPPEDLREKLHRH